MIDDTDFRRVFADFGNSIGLQGLALGAGGYRLLEIDGFSVHVTHMEEVGEVLFAAVIGTLPAYPSAAFLTWLLTESFEQMATRGVAFAIDGDDNSVVLLRRFSTRGLTAETFTQEIETVAALAESGAREIKARPSESMSGDMHAFEKI